MKRNELIADFQGYVRDRIARYDFPMGPDAINDEGRRAYTPVSMIGNGYDTYEE